MKIAIVSDLHLGYERFREDAYAQAKQALDLAASCSDAILLPGDIFDVRAPKPEVLAEGINLFRDLGARHWSARVSKYEGASGTYTSLPIIAIPGTHERRANGAENPISLLNLAGLIVDASEARVTLEKDGERVAVVGIGGIAEEKFGEYLKESAMHPADGAFNILMFHQTLKELLPFGDDILALEDLPDGFDLYVDGHIHNKVRKTVHGKPFIIPGSTVLTQLKDNEQEPKGFYVYDTASGSCEFREIKSRPFFVVKVSAEGKAPDELRDSVRSGIESALKRSDAQPIVKVVLDGSLKSGFKAADADLSGIGQEYRGRAFVEVSRSGIDDSASELSGLRNGLVENVPVKDLGMGIFIERLKQAGYSLPIGPSALFEILSGDSKEKATKRAIEELFGNAE